MRGKRAKQYRKLMHEYALTFSFREPYQVLLDADIIRDASRFKMDLIDGLQRTLQGRIKPMITQCSIRHLYSADPKDETIIEQAKGYERRRCNHHDLQYPLSSLQCFADVLDPKGSRTNKHRYIVASQDPEVRSHMRQIPGVPLLYIHRSVMIMEPMAQATIDVRNHEERAKLKTGIYGRQSIPGLSKRKQGEERTEDDAFYKPSETTTEAGQTAQNPIKRRKRIAKGPNPLSVKKPKKKIMTI